MSRGSEFSVLAAAQATPGCSAPCLPSLHVSPAVCKKPYSTLGLVYVCMYIYIYRDIDIDRD